MIFSRKQKPYMKGKLQVNHVHYAIRFTAYVDYTFFLGQIESVRDETAWIVLSCEDGTLLRVRIVSIDAFWVT